MEGIKDTDFTHLKVPITSAIAFALGVGTIVASFWIIVSNYKIETIEQINALAVQFASMRTEFDSFKRTMEKEHSVTLK